MPLLPVVGVSDLDRKIALCRARTLVQKLNSDLQICLENRLFKAAEGISSDLSVAIANLHSVLDEQKRLQDQLEFESRERAERQSEMALEDRVGSAFGPS